MKVAVALQILFVCGAVGFASKITVDDIIKDVNKYLDTGRKTLRFRHTLDMLKLETPLKGTTTSLDMKIMKLRAGSGSRRRIPCGVCSLAMSVAAGWIRSGNSRTEVVNKAVRLCTLFNVQKEYVCRGFVESHVDLALYLHEAKVQSKEPYVPSDICGLALYPECPFRANTKNHYEWSIDLDYLGPKPPVEPIKPIDENARTMQVLQITDVHIDPQYTPGSNALCVEPTCCRNDSSPTTVPAGGGAGYWGDYRDCDSPFHAFQNLVQQAAKTHPNVSYIMFTGDSVDHAMWTTGQEKNSDVYEKVINEIRVHFPNTPLLPAIGNHEPHPANVWIDFSGEENSTSRELPPLDISSEWVYEMAAKAWLQWLPTTIRSSVQQGGSYAHEIMPGLVIVSLNNNFCYTYNWWLQYKSYDPAGQLQWLADTLKQAEENGQKVHIMAHIAANTYNCLGAWRRQYQRIVNRFENTVVAQFHGHEHTDYFSLYYDPENKTRANSVAFTAGSATAYTDVNPNYRVYTIEAQDGFRVLDHETWSYNLTEANAAGPDELPKWKKLYSFNEAYGTASLLPNEMHDLFHRLATNTTLQKQYFRHTVREADRALAKGCDANCMRFLLCDIVDADPKGRSRCVLPRPKTLASPRQLSEEPDEVEENEDDDDDYLDDDYDLEEVLADLLAE